MGRADAIILNTHQVKIERKNDRIDFFLKKEKK